MTSAPHSSSPPSPSHLQPDRRSRTTESSSSRTVNDHEITELLTRWSEGDRAAAEAVLPMVYDDLHRIAERYFRGERPDHTLQATAIVHDAYLQLSDQRGIRWNDRSHFLGVAAHAMRRILVDYSRRHNAAKRNGRWHQVTLAEADSLETGGRVDLVDLGEALDRLGELDPEKAKIVELRFFGGLTIDEVSRFLGLSEATVNRRWRRARAWLYRELRPSAAGASRGA